jgi:spermidine synthase
MLIMNYHMRPLLLRVSLFIKGLSGIVAQIILMRELLISFLGNELTLGIILANWLILVAIGSFVVGKTVEKVERKLEVFVSFQLFFSMALPFTIYLSRIFKNIFLATPGEGLGFAPIFYSSFLILLPVTLPQGALFTYGCKLYSQYIRPVASLGFASQASPARRADSPRGEATARRAPRGEKDVSSIGKVYVLESIGAIIGGLLMTFLLIQYLNSFEIALIISLINAVISALLVWPVPTSSNHPIKNALWVLSGLLSLVFAYGLLPQTSNSIHLSSIRSQWRNLHVIHNENSIYGNITVTKRGEQFTFFTNGVPSITTPVPDIASIEDFVHFPMLFHEKPESVLILSGGVGGMIHEILKYPVKHVDYVELDPLLLKLAHKFSTPLTQTELADKRVRTHYADSRFFVKRTQDRFDMIFVGLPAPQELQTNRLFSSEFFSSVKEKMNSDGIIVLTLPGSLTYISPELRDLNACILDTLKTVFRSVRIIPGDANLYIASDSDQLRKVTTEEIIKRFEVRNIQTNLFTRGYIEYRLHERWMKWFSQSMERREIQINSDFRPVGVFLSLSYWNALFSPYLTGIFKWFEGFSLQISIALMVLFTFLMAVIFVKRPYFARQSVPYAIFATGLAGMIFNLGVIFTFQTFYGYLYHQIGLLIAIFMFGVALSSFYMTRRLDKIEKDSHLFLKIEIRVILFSFLFPFVFLIPSQYLEKTATALLIYPVFLIMSFLSGAWIGLQFPLATKIYLGAPANAETLGHTAGLIYGADLLGGFLGGLLGGILLLPILGLKESCFMMAMIKISSGILFLLFIKLKK